MENMLKLVLFLQFQANYGKKTESQKMYSL